MKIALAVACIIAASVVTVAFAASTPWFKQIASANLPELAWGGLHGPTFEVYTDPSNGTTCYLVRSVNGPAISCIPASNPCSTGVER